MVEELIAFLVRYIDRLCIKDHELALNSWRTLVLKVCLF